MRFPRSLQLRIALVVALVILLAAFATAYFIRVEMLESDASAALALEYRELLQVLAPFAFAAPIAAFAAARWSLRPLDRIEKEALTISARNSDQRLSEDKAPFEARGLVVAVNGALDRIAEAYAHQRQFTANAAHALRTPLTVISLRLQEAIDKNQIDPIIYTEDLQRLRRVVDQLLTLGRIDGLEQRKSEQRVDLSRVARGVAAELLPLAGAHGRSLEVQSDEPQVAQADGESIALILRNLIENAVIHGLGKITIITGTDEDSVWAMVVDEGFGPPPDIRMNSFDRFARGVDSRGSGLGLSIACDAARAIGGNIEWGTASAIHLTLPLPEKSTL